MDKNRRQMYFLCAESQVKEIKSLLKKKSVFLFQIECHRNI